MVTTMYNNLLFKYYVLRDLVKLQRKYYHAFYNPVARQNMLGEFIKQEKMLQQKCVEKKEKIAVMNEAYETELKKIEEKVFRGKET